MKAYSTREVAELLGLSTARVRSLMRSGVVTPQRTNAGRATFTFQDLVLLRTAKGLIDAKVPARRITKALQALASQLPTDRPLSAVRVQIDGDRVIVRDSANIWEPESKQTVLDFSVRELGEKVAPLARESVQRALRAASTADDLFQAAIESEEIGATAEAESAYRNTIAADAAHVAAHINLGRLRHVGKALDEAEAALSASARARAGASDGAVQSRRRARGPRRNGPGDRAVSRSRAPRPARGRRALQSRAALSANRRSAGGAAALFAVSGADARSDGLTSAAARYRSGFGECALQQLGEILRGDGRAEVEALHLVAEPIAQERLLLRRLDAFGDDREAQRLAHRDDRLGDRLVLGVVRHLADERAVDLQACRSGSASSARATNSPCRSRRSRAARPSP